MDTKHTIRIFCFLALVFLLSGCPYDRNAIVESPQPSHIQGSWEAMKLKGTDLFIRNFGNRSSHKINLSPLIFYLPRDWELLCL